VAGLGVSVALIIVVAAAGPSAAVPAFPAAYPWPPYFAHAGLSPALASALTWAAVLVGGAGLAFGLLAARRGWRPRPRHLIIASIVAVAALTALPPVGSTDMLDYAAYGRIAALGHSPYQMTPVQLKRSGDPVGAVAPVPWQKAPSAYGPLATLTERAAAQLSGASAARTLLWLKVWNGLAYLAIAAALDRLLRSDATRRVRAHLLWTVNPLMLLGVMAGGHVDGLAAGAGVIGVLAFRRGNARRALVAGLLVGAAVAVKAPFALFGAGLAWATVRSPRSLTTLTTQTSLAALAAGAAAVLVPSYLLAGPGAISAIERRSTGGVDLYEPWQLLSRPLAWPHPSGRVDEIALAAAVLLAGLLLWRLPAGPPGLPAVRPALALSLAWLVCSPQQRPWFDAMIFPLLAVMPATRLDWITLVRAAAAATAELPGVTYYTRLRPRELELTANLISRTVAPAVLVVAAIALVWLCVTGRWTPGPRPGGPEAPRPLADLTPVGRPG